MRYIKAAEEIIRIAVSNGYADCSFDVPEVSYSFIAFEFLDALRECPDEAKAAGLGYIQGVLVASEFVTFQDTITVNGMFLNA